jgi:hypothetical protein
MGNNVSQEEAEARVRNAKGELSEHHQRQLDQLME